MKYVRPYLDTPEVSKHRPQQYDFITHEVWEEFVRQKLTDEYQVLFRYTFKSSWSSFLLEFNFTGIFHFVHLFVHFL